MRYLMGVAALALAACSNGSTGPISSGPVGGPTSGSFPTGLENTCDGERYGTLVGQDATVLERVLILGLVRVIRPGAVVTQDYRPERLNFEIGSDGRIARISCG